MELGRREPARMPKASSDRETSGFLWAELVGHFLSSCLQAPNPTLRSVGGSTNRIPRLPGAPGGRQQEEEGKGAAGPQRSCCCIQDRQLEPHLQHHPLHLCPEPLARQRVPPLGDVGPSPSSGLRDACPSSCSGLSLGDPPTAGFQVSFIPTSPLSHQPGHRQGCLFPQVLQP